VAAPLRRRDRRAYLHLFAAQVLALLGTGVATVALALLSYELAGADAGAVFGTALAIKTAAYVVIAPLASAFTVRLPRRAVLVAADLVRAVVALAMPFVTAVWQIHVLIFVFQASSAVFTPVFQATIPEVLPEEGEYAGALARARLAYELEGAISPMLAAGLLLVMDGPALFVCTSAAFLVSAGLILRVTLPPPAAARAGDALGRLRRGFAIFATTPRLRGLVLLTLAAALGTAMVVVNTVVLVDERLGEHDRATAIGLATYGVGSVVGTLAMPMLLARLSPRTLMLGGAALVSGALLAGAAVSGVRPLLPLWLAIGLGTSSALAPYGILVRRSAQPEEKPPLYAANSAIGHLALLLAYPVAGQLGAGAGMTATFALLGAAAAVAAFAAALVWRHEPIADPMP
jgi:MFS family permease